MYMYAVKYAIATKPLILLKTSPYTYTHMYNVVVNEKLKILNQLNLRCYSVHKLLQKHEIF